MKKLYGSIISFLLTTLTLAVSVFAWVTYSHNVGSTKGFSGSAMEGAITIEGDREKVDLFLGSSLTDLTYLSIGDFEQSANYLKGLASIVKITVSNHNDVDVYLNLRLRTIPAAEYGELSGQVSSLKYFIIENPANFNSFHNEIKNLSSNTFYNNINIYNTNNKIKMNAASGSTPTEKDLYIYVWGDFDKLTINQKTHLQFIAYRLSLSIRLVGNE